MRVDGVGPISGEPEVTAAATTSATPESEPEDASRRTKAPTMYRIRRVLAIRAFRRLWGVTYLCSVADWLALLGLVGLASRYFEDYAGQNYAFVGVVLTNLVPGLIFAPLGGLLADRFDRRKVMIVADILRFGLMLSIALVNVPAWLFIGSFLVGSTSMMWIPSKDAAVPNLLRRREQVETANQLGLVMTYGFAVVTGAGLYAVITGIGPMLNLPPELLGQLGIAKIVVVINSFLYLFSALLIATRIPELSLRDVHEKSATQGSAASAADPDKRVGVLRMIRDGARYIRGTRLVRGLLIGMSGAFAAGGFVVGASKPYSASLGGGDASFGLLFVAVFVGLATGMATAPKLTHRLPHDRLFGIAIVGAGLALIPVAVSPALVLSLVSVAVIGCCAGMAFLTGVTIIGSQVEDAIRGRINAIYQALMKIILFGSTISAPVIIAAVGRRTITVFGRAVVVDATRPVLLGASLLATAVGVVAYRQMDSRRGEPILADLRNVLRRNPRRVNGLLVAVEGITAADTAGYASRLADRLAAGPRDVVLASDPALDDERLSGLVAGASLTGARAQALAAAAVRADIVEREIRPALDAGSIVVMERFVDSPLAHLSAVAGLDVTELEGLADWATGRLRPDVTVLLDTSPDAEAGTATSDTEPRWQVQRLLAEMAAADPDRYVVVDTDGPDADGENDGDDEAVARVLRSVDGALGGEPSAHVPDGDDSETVSTA